MNSPRSIELLAPAKNAEIAIEALKHGADAVYIGAPSHGARSAATNTIADIERVASVAHKFRARVYVTLNTLVYDSELQAVERLVKQLYRAGVDALIVQDMSLLCLDLPPIALHASTQCDIRTPEKARFLADAGFSQLVLPRELTLEETAEIRRALPDDVALEAFVHGALCVSYSGDCQAGFATQRRSANRGECPQICRHSFDLVDGRGNRLIENRHLLSLRDLNRLSLLPELLAAGVSSFKIEGRLKDAAYVKNTVAAYRQALDRIISQNPELYRRASVGESEISFTPDLDESFNRGFTTYFTTAAKPTGKMASVLTPKWIGREVGTVITSSPKQIKASLSAQLSNGDGLGYFNSEGRFSGFRVNRVEGNVIYPASTVNIARGTKLYRNNNKQREDALAAETARRTIDIDLTLRQTPTGFAVDACTKFGPAVTLAETADIQPARNNQAQQHRKTLCKTGDTIFQVDTLTDLAQDAFIPLSLLTDVRRRVLSELERNILATHPLELRRRESADAKWAGEPTLTYHDNVANRLSHRFYTDHGATSIQPALETGTRPAGPLRVMTTRYCLRRECGHCLLTEAGRDWPRDLYLVSGPMRFKLEFDCSNCRMHLLTT